MAVLLAYPSAKIPSCVPTSNKPVRRTLSNRIHAVMRRFDMPSTAELAPASLASTARQWRPERASAEDRRCSEPDRVNGPIARMLPEHITAGGIAQTGTAPIDLGANTVDMKLIVGMGFAAALLCRLTSIGAGPGQRKVPENRH